MSEPRTASKPARAPGVVLAMLAAALVALVATALSPAQPPPPPTAELAPAPLKPIAQAPPDQTSETGEAGGSGGGGRGGHRTVVRHVPGQSGGPGDGGGPGRGARVDTQFTCYGSPPRQLPDPQSPPCVITQVKDNGGATSRGVTPTTIRIAFPNNSDGAQTQALLNYFNTHMNLYGRKVVIADNDGCFGGGTPQSMKSSADGYAQQRLFAVVGWCDAKGTEYPFYDQLARDKVVSVSNRPSLQTEDQFAANHPYEWTFLPPFDVGQTHLADLACSLSGPAAYAGPSLSGSQRKLGVVYNTFTDAPSPSIAPLLSTLQGCGLGTPETFGIAIARNGGPAAGSGYTSESVQQTNAAVLQMRQDGVTTVLLLTHSDTTKQVAQIASGQGYQPELMVSTYSYNDFDEDTAALPPDQQQHVFGISTWNKFIAPPEEYWYQAIQAGDPTYTFPYGHLSYLNALYTYYPLEVLFAGLQMAGPDLTPETFAAGLEQARYPNPAIPRHQEGKVTVAAGQHSYIADASVIWFDPSQPDPDYGTQGSYCYLDDGARFAVGGYPRNPQLFTPGRCPRYG